MTCKGETDPAHLEDMLHCAQLPCVAANCRSDKLDYGLILKLQRALPVRAIKHIHTARDVQR